ncbi:MAG: type II toxin-antitoxin system Phd/YefM family antitoxin [Caulobacterales bacterium]|nr:type II toxin-antitoxin system Phd/YefM family antitoxin [Caulobacterales bacterium]
MRTVGVLEAKTSLSALIEEVETSGETIVITRHGKAVARLSPERSGRLTPSGLAERARAFRNGQPKDSEWACLSWEDLKAIARDGSDR